jgi:hypothetical protein
MIIAPSWRILRCEALAELINAIFRHRYTGRAISRMHEAVAAWRSDPQRGHAAKAHGLSLEQDQDGQAGRAHLH